MHPRWFLFDVFYKTPLKIADMKATGILRKFVAEWRGLEKRPAVLVPPPGSRAEPQTILAISRSRSTWQLTNHTGGLNMGIFWPWLKVDVFQKVQCHLCTERVLLLLLFLLSKKYIWLLKENATHASSGDSRGTANVPSVEIFFVKDFVPFISRVGCHSRKPRPSQFLKRYQ